MLTLASFNGSIFELLQLLISLSKTNETRTVDGSCHHLSTVKRTACYRLVAIVAFALADWKFCFKIFLQFMHIDTAVINELFQKYSIYCCTVWWLIDTAIW